MQPFPEKIYPIEYGGFWNFNITGSYESPDLLNESENTDAERLCKEIADRYNNYPKLLAELETLKKKINNL